MRTLFVFREKQVYGAAVFVEKTLTHLYLESPMSKSAGEPGRFYRAVVRDVVPALSAVFVDIGLARPALLKQEDFPLRANGKLAVGERLLVQLLKAASEEKAAQVSGRCSLAGDKLIFLPDGGQASVSAKIGDATERARLLKTLIDLSAPGEGWVARTQAAQAEDAGMVTDAERLRARWFRLCADVADWAAGRNRLPGLIEEGPGFALRVMRRFSFLNLKHIHYDPVFAAEVEDASFRETIAGWREPCSIAVAKPALRTEWFGFLLKQVKHVMQTDIVLQSGGSIKIEQTAALTTVDVNSGKSERDTSLEATALRTNLEAAEQLAIALRLLEIGGIVIVDFIKMARAEERLLVLQRFEKATADDTSKVTVAGWTHLGLLELTRRRTHIQDVHSLL